MARDDSLTSAPAGPSLPPAAEAGGRENVHHRRSRFRRQEILQAAAAAFGNRGFHRASLQEIGSGAGITPAGLLHHFKTKEALLTELLKLRDEVDMAEASVPVRPTGLAFLQHLIDTAARNSERIGITQLYAVLSAEGVTEDHPAQEWFRVRYAGLRDLIVDALIEATEAGDIQLELDPVQTASAIIALMDGLQIQWLYTPAAVDMAGVMEAMMSSLLHPRKPFVH